MFKTLIVDDNKTVREAIVALLRTHFPSMIITQASCSDEALKMAHELTPDLILMDIKLPGINGLQVTRSIRSRISPEPVVIVLSGHDLPEYRQAALQNGARYFLSKSLSSGDELLKIVESVYDGSRS